MIIGRHKDLIPIDNPNNQLPGAWLPCDGRIVNDPSSPFHGLKLPNLNDGFGYHLRGGQTTGRIRESTIIKDNGQLHETPNQGRGHYGSGFFRIANAQGNEGEQSMYSIGRVSWTMQVAAMTVEYIIRIK